MRVYISGKLSKKLDGFHPEDIWFCNEDADENDELSEDCCCISGEYIDSMVEGKAFSCVWRGSTFKYIDEDGEECEEEDFTAEEFISFIKERGMSLANMSAYTDEVDATIEDVQFGRGDDAVHLPKELLPTEPIEFIL